MIFGGFLAISTWCMALAFSTHGSYNSQEELMGALENGCSSLDGNCLRAIAVMKKVDRAIYCGCRRGKCEMCGSGPYSDTPGALMGGQTISAPHMHLYALKYLARAIDRKLDVKVLDIGSGSGYLTACFAHMTGQGSQVIGVELIPELVEFSIRNLNHDGRPGGALESVRNKIQIMQGDGTNLDLQPGSFDAIHVGATIDANNSKGRIGELVSLLKIGGILVAPVESSKGGPQYMRVLIKKKDGTFTEIGDNQGVRYVPLVEKR